jgi:hypothetical protein
LCRITCGLYINIVLNDYIGTLVGIPELDTAWILDPHVGGGTESLTIQDTPVATGNQVSCEFNLAYRFHSIISDRDEKWVTNFMKELFPGKDPTKLSTEEFREGLLGYIVSIDPDPAKRGLHGIKRDKDGKLDDASLIKVLKESTEDCAG